MSIQHTNDYETEASRELDEPGRATSSSDALSSPSDAHVLRAFDNLPHAVMVLDSDGALLASNRLAHQLLATVPAEATGERLCCAILGCRSPGGPLEGSCMSELALAVSEACPDVRVDLPPGSPWEAAWASASRNGEESDNVVVTLRQAKRHDRRRRTEPHWMVGPYLRIGTLGRTAIRSREAPLEGAWLGQKTGKLLKYLVCQRGMPAPAERIAAALWPQADSRALNSVRYYVHTLRDVLEPGRSKPGGSSFVVATPGGYMLDNNRVEVDADLFEQHVRTGLSAAVSDQVAVAVKSLDQAFSVYGGDFLADEPYSEWAFEERESLRRLAAEASRALARISLRTGDLESTRTHVERLVGLSPHDADLQRLLFALYLKLGRRTEAWRGYRALRQRMASMFGEELDFELASLNPDVELRALHW
ncbi:MAG: winged helix-turn-helix domain-containing protein [Actinobacteria bacterium]|nr:winged helix-turn-helix domain-containing protein [Actinomycetota bacterium]